MKKVFINIIVLFISLLFVSNTYAATVAIGDNTTYAGEKDEVSILLEGEDLANYKKVTFKLSFSEPTYISAYSVTPISGQNYGIDNNVYTFKNEEGLSAMTIGTLSYTTSDKFTGSLKITPVEVKFYSETDETIEGVSIIDGEVKEGTIKYQQPKSSDASLTELTVSQGTLTPSFDKDINEYTVIVPDTINSIRISATGAIGSAKPTGTGSKSLSMGENKFEVEVTAEDGNTKKKYTITVIRGEILVPSAYIKSLTINNADTTISPEFDKLNNIYTIETTGDIEKLDIKYELEDSLATCEILGNEDFKVGENIVTLLVTSSDSKLTQKYELIVNIEEKEEEVPKVNETTGEEPKKNNKWILIAIIFGSLLLIGGTIFVLFRNKKKKNKDNNPVNEDKSITELIKEDLYSEEKTERFDAKLFNEALNTQEDLEKTKEFNFKTED